MGDVAEIHSAVGPVRRRSPGPHHSLRIELSDYLYDRLLLLAKTEERSLVGTIRHLIAEAKLPRKPAR